jgi:uncharacterized protein (TIGR02271 family)
MMSHAREQPRSDDDALRIPLVEERVEIRKRAVETGRVRVHKSVEEQRQVVDEPLAGEVVEVERIAVGRVVERAEPPREADGVTIVPVYEEKLVVEKRLVLTEEIHIRRRRTERREPVEVVIRKERAEIERLDPQPPGQVDPASS